MFKKKQTFYHCNTIDLKNVIPKLIKLAVKAMVQDKANEEINRATNEQI